MRSPSLALLPMNLLPMNLLADRDPFGVRRVCLCPPGGQGTHSASACAHRPHVRPDHWRGLPLLPFIPPSCHHLSRSLFEQRQGFLFLPLAHPPLEDLSLPPPL